MDEIKNKPYEYIINHYEKIYPSMGGKVFSVLALLPPSLIIPKLKRKNKLIRSSISLILLSPPGSGKTSIAQEFEKVACNPLSTENITPSRLIFEINKKNAESKNVKISLIVSDVSSIFQDEELIKVMENILEEGYVSRNTMRNKKEETKTEIQAVAYLSGTPDNINDNRIKRGLLFRALNMLVFHSKEDHNGIIKFICESMGKNSEIDNSHEKIRIFYDDLLKIQEGTHSEFNPITGFIFSDSIKKEVEEFIKLKTGDIFERYGITFARSVEDMFRVMASHSFLNIYNRKRENNELIIEEEDLKVAKKVVGLDLWTKKVIMRSMEQIDYYNIRTLNQLREWEQKRKQKSQDTPKELRFVMEGLIK